VPDVELGYGCFNGRVLADALIDAGRVGIRPHKRSSRQLVLLIGDWPFSYTEAKIINLGQSIVSTTETPPDECVANGAIITLKSRRAQ
jgi:hypothetical protein